LLEQDGGKSWTYTPGQGGGLSGYSYYSVSKPGTQTTGYALGKGKDAWGAADSDGVAGGGSGYYGGETNNVSCQSSGAGGSSYISGHDGCDAIAEETTEDNIIHTGQSVHYSGLKFKDTVMIDGAGYEWTTEKGSYTKMEDPSGNYVDGKSGNGYARITLLEDPSENNLLKEIQVDKGTLTPEVDYDTTEYSIELGPDDTSLTVYGVVDDITATVEGNGTYDIAAGENKIELKVIAESGDERIYTITVTREASDNAKPIDITIDGLIESLISVNPIYGKLDPETFDVDTHEYSMIVPSRIKKLTFNVEKGHKYQNVTGDGLVELAGGENQITITVTSEDGSQAETYIYNIERDISGNCLLESLTIDNVETDLEFDQDILEYFITVPNEITNLDITAIPEIETIVPQIIGNTNLKVGLNDIHILVTADNGEQLVYVIHCYRMMSGNTFLDYIKVLDGTTELSLSPNYNKILDSYVVNVPNEVKSVKIDAKPEADTSSVSGTGNKLLNTGNNTYELEVTAEDGSIGTYTVMITREKSANNYLSKLECNQGSLIPEFDKENTEYKITVDSSVKSLSLSLAKEDETAKVEVSGNQNFVVGDNEVVIKVTAENGNVREYKIIVNRLASENNYLLNLKTDYGTLTPEFDKDVSEYSVEVENEVEKITVSATKEDPYSTITGLGKYALSVGENTINIAVQAENGDMREYQLKVTRKLSSNANLLRVENDKKLVVNKKNESTYTISAPNDVNKLQITGIAEKSTSTVVGNDTYDLDLGENKVILKVIAEDGTEKEYTVLITREKSNNAYLSYILADEGSISPVFDKNVTDYTLKTLYNVDCLNLDIQTEDPEATYTVVGNENLKYGENKLTIIVTASDGKTQKYYNIDVYKQAQNIDSNDLISLTVNKGTLTPTFDSNTLVYDVEVPYTETSIIVDAIALDANAVVTGTGEYSLEVGINLISVNVTSTDGIEKTYQIRVTRNKSNDARLSSLSVDGYYLNPTFDPDTNSYTIETTLTDINVQAIPIEDDATYTISGNTNLQKGTNMVTIEVTAPDGVTNKTYTIKAVRTNSNNNNLSSLSVVGYEISPEFNKSTLVYTTYVENDINSVMIEATADEDTATISGIGSVALNTGKNVVQVEVTSESGKVKTYTVIIYRGASDNNYLESLEISEGTLNPEFDKLVNSYTTEVEYETESIVLTGKAEDETAKVTGLGKNSLQVGDNIIQVKVVSESGIENIYTVNVKRKAAISAKIKQLSISPYTLSPTFNMDVNEYNVTVDNEITKLDLNIETLDPNATYVVSGNEDFQVGMNKVTIDVTSSDGLKHETYIINVTRQLSSNNYLDYILVSEGKLNPNYVKTTIYYEVKVGNEVTSIDVDGETSDSNATVTGFGTYSLNTGENLIKIEVTSVSGITRTYTINVIRAKNGNNYLSSLSVKNGSTNLEMTPIFDKTTQEYNVVVPEGTTRAQILATAESDLAQVTGSGYVTVVAGENKYNINVIAEDGNARTYTINLTRPKSSNNYLTELIPSVGVLEPSFAYDETEYTLTVGNLDSFLSFEVNTENRFAKVEGIDEEEIPDGESTREIVVTAEDGTTRTYTIKVIRNRTDDARLASLQVKSYTLDQEFNEDLFEYTLTVPNDKFELTENEIVAKPKYEDSTVYLVPKIQLEVLNLNTYSIIVTAPDGYTTQTYTIYVTRQKSSNSTLSKLAVSGYEITPAFTSENTEYTVSIPKGTSKLSGDDVIAVPTDQYATVEKMEELDLTTEDTQYTVTVTSHDESSTTIYTINVEEAKAEDNYLESLTVTPGELSPAFDTNIVNYEVHVKKNQENITIDAVPKDSTAKVISGTGTIALEDNETDILVLIRAENEKLRGYVLKVYRDIELADIKGKVITNNTDNVHKATVKLYSEEQEKNQIETNQDGTFYIEADAGTYDVVIEKPGYLTYTVKNIVLGEMGEVEFEDYALIAGDVNGDGEIELSDLVALNDNIGITVSYEEGVTDENAKYDFNGDGIIDKEDRNILKANYGKQAETIEWVNPNALIATTSLEMDDLLEDDIEEAELEEADLTEADIEEADLTTNQEEDIDADENETLATDNEQNVENQEETTTFILPMKTEYTITSEYGYRTHPTTGEYKKHTGIDISGVWHTEIYSVADGEVVDAGVDASFGNYVEIKHIVNGEAIYSFYAHLSRIDVTVGQTVAQGEQIGLEGGAESDENHGNSTGHHLHFEIRTASGYGNDVDPSAYLEF
jgi:murein DD-endopeptidase MepM/ murein hydrolase activator NlpD